MSDELSENAALVAAPNEDDGPDAGEALVRQWLGELALAKRKLQDWHTRGDRVIRRYKDERGDREIIQDTRGRKMNLLWSNVETTKPAYYSATPVPNVSRMNKDGDPVGRVASLVLERTLVAALAYQDFDRVMRDSVQDMLLPGRGVVVVDYAPTVEADAVADQRVSVRYVHWKDFFTNNARTWDEVWFVALRAFLTREEVTKRWGPQIGAAIVLDHRPRDDSGRFMPGSNDAKATIWTVWDMRHGEVIQLSPGYATAPLAVMEPPVKFTGFFPVPRPITATTASDSIIPVPDFAMYQDQADEIDLLTNRIYKLSESLRLRGLYPADMDSVKRLLSDATDTDLIPVENWAMLGERGGADGLVAWFPLAEVAKTLSTCIEAREKAKQALYEVTGIGDIIRGATQASETATAQQLKSQWGSLRIRDRQRDIQRFARDVIRLMAEVIAEHFTQETLAAMSGVKLLTAQQKRIVQMYQMQAQAGQMMQPPRQLPPDMLAAMDEPTWDDVMALLRNDKLRSFSIDVETDSTVAPDQQAEQQSRTQFITAVTQYIAAAGPILQQAPMAAPLLGQLLLFGVRGWKIGEPLETAIETFTQQVTQAAQVPKPPDPKMAADQAKAQVDMESVQAERQRTQTDAQIAQGQQALDAAELADKVEDRRHESMMAAHERSMAAHDMRMAAARPAREKVN